METLFRSKEGFALPIPVPELSGSRMGGSLPGRERGMKRPFQRWNPIAMRHINI